MGAKLKTHLQNMFFDFLSRFLRIWLQSLQKVLIWPPIFFFFNQKRYQKRRISRCFESVENDAKNAHKKSYKQNKFDEQR